MQDVFDTNIKAYIYLVQVMIRHLRTQDSRGGTADRQAGTLFA